MRLVAFAVALCLASSVVAQEPGVQWQVTTSMEMGGMKLPGRTSTVCAPVTADSPEQLSGNDECTVSNVRRTANGFTYDMRCPDGSGSGEMTWQGRDSWTQKMRMTADGETMTMLSTAKRGGSCDAGAMKRQVAQMEADMARQKSQSCGQLADSMMPSMMASMGCDPSARKKLCDRFATKDGFREVASRQATGDPQVDTNLLPDVAKYCAADAQALRTRFCRDAVRGSDLDYVGKVCPADAQAIAQRECAGRSVSTPPAEKYRDFCYTYAADLMQGSPVVVDEAPAAESPAEAAKQGVKEGAKKLRGLLGF